jgi:hypothetical protein
VPCASCGSNDVEQREAEITIHSPRLEDIEKPPVLVFAQLSVCLNCGKAECVVPQPQLGRLSNDPTASDESK